MTELVSHERRQIEKQKQNQVGKWDEEQIKKLRGQEKEKRYKKNTQGYSGMKQLRKGHSNRENWL